MPNLNKEAIHRFLQSDRAILLLCISMALIFWLLTKLSKSFPTTQTFEIVYNLPKNQAYAEMPPTSILARIQGKGWDLVSNYLKSSDRALVLNLSNRQEQTIFSNQIRNLVAERMSTPDITITGLYPDNISIKLEEKATKKVPLLFNSTIVYKNNFYQKDSLKLTPDSVLISGPISLIDSTYVWETVLFKKTNVDRDISQVIRLQKSSNSTISMDIAEATIDIAVEQQTEKSIFVPLHIKNKLDSLRIFPEQTKITFVVGFSRFDAISAKDFQPEVDFKNVQINSTKNTLPIYLANYPSFVRNIQLNPKSVEFYILK